MTTVIRFVVCAAVLCLTTAAQTQADPIEVTGGTMTAFWSGISAQGLVPTAITGTRGFSVTGDALASEGRIDIFDGPCDCPPGYITPGSTASIGAFIGTFNATATFEGNSYAIDEGINSPNVVSMSLIGNVGMPAFSETHPVVTAPFAIESGLFFSDSPRVSEKLIGGGIASLSLSPFHLPDDPDVWRVDKIVYEFSPSAVTPEPATLTLAALGLMGATVRARRRGAAL
jgi:hypothetical protein